MIYHLLPELEPFSAIQGGALARDVANIMHWNPTDIAVCLRADESWGYSADRILEIPGLREYGKIKGRRFLPNWMAGPFLRRAFRPLMSRLKSGDIVWNHNQMAFSAALGKSIHAKGAKLVHHFHDGHAPFGTQSALKCFTPDATIFVSDFLRRRWSEFFPSINNAYAIPNGADDALFRPAPEGAGQKNVVPNILFVGRLHAEKGVHVLMDAMRILQERNVDVVCRVVGSAFSGGTKPTPYVESLLNSSPSNVKFEGHRSARRIAEKYREADILCCPSIWQEPFGNVNIEAMASGIPVVATRVGGIPEIAAEGGVLLVEPNSAVGLADALQRLVEDKELRMEVAAKGLKAFHRRYTWAAVCRQYQEIMESI
jgi:spore coat protein SA